MNTIKKIAVLTSGGDAPGMNAAIRAVVRTGIYHDLDVIGVQEGYQGLVDNAMHLFKTKDVANIIQRGGTILKTARSEDFTTPEGRKKAFRHLQENQVDALITIGGDGTFKGASVFSDEYQMPVLGIPGTIDNDIAGTEYTIGFDTAVNTAIEAIDKIRDTASAHDRVFVVEVMGRHSGLIALQSGVSCGAEDILVPEQKTDFDQLIREINYDKRRNKYMRIIVVCEGDDFGGANKVAEEISRRFPKLDVRPTILGHIQRGGSPTHYDRWMASRFGYEAVKAILKHESKKMLALKNGRIQLVPFENDEPRPQPHLAQLEMAKILSF